ncbi:MAG TPA: DNA polymerase III subunit beta [Eubacteriaceae bacterium]|nr:DNA polymerase III subunit beta [Eubacteriaceae bacterium]
MKFICSRKTLLNGFSIVQKAVSTRTTLPILEGVLIQAEGNTIKLIATDLEIGIEKSLEGEIIEEGSIVLPANIIVELIRKLPDAPVEIKCDQEYRTKITCLKSEFVIQGQSSEDFPNLPTIEDENSIEIPQDLLRNIIRQTIFSVASDPTRPILTGALMEIQSNELRLIALDGYRLALRKGKTENRDNYGISEVIPGKTLNEISKILTNDDEMVRISRLDKQMLFEYENTKITTRLLEGEFINYNQILPDEYKTRIKVYTNDLIESCERAELLARQGKNNLIKVEILQDQLVITSNAEIGHVREELPIEIEGEELKIAFNSRYILDALKVIEEEEIYLDFTTSVSPCIIRPVEDDNFVYLILPVRLLKE